ncbi:MAG: efflux RND transporter permease subunit [Candidatus Competibacteraceae bacterium]|nr:efflux RND transporter permease subunit [Candidatus Competibacteraceae bacterium]
MVLSDISIKRPVLATVMNLLLVLVGLIAYDRLPVREYPNIDVPVVTVETAYPGASAPIIESQVTQVLEDSLAGIEGIDFISSISRAESSQITVTFRLDRDADGAASDVRDRVGRVRGRLPADVEEPVVAKVEADAQPVIWLAFSSDRHSALEVSDVAETQVKDRLETIPGVASIRIVGERRYAMRIWLDRTRLAAYRLTPQDVENALRAQNLEVPSGRIESTDREFTVLAETDLRTPTQFRQVILRDAGGYLVRLGDVAQVTVGAEAERTVARYKGQSAVALGIVKQSTANPLALSQALRAELPAVIASLPEGMEVNVAYDSSVFIDRSIQAVFTTILEAVLLVILVIFLFLRSLRATLIPLVTIPVSLIGAFAIMYLAGFTVNTLTLLAMVLAIGLVVDDAIVMLENIHRHIEKGLAPMEAALKGSREIAFAVIAMTLTLAAVFTPIAFSTGRTGKLFTEFALTLAGAVLVSGFIALTLSPMMCSRMLKHESHGRFYNLGERVLEAMNRGYRMLLRGALKVWPLVLLVALGVALGTYLLFAGLKSELSPVEDRGTILAIGIAPEGATVEYTDRYARIMEGIVSQVEEVERYFAIVGFPTVTQVIMFAGLSDWEERQQPQQAITGQLAGQMFAGVPGLLAFATNPPSLGQSPISKAVEVVVQTTGSYDQLQGIVEQIIERARDNPGLANLDSDLKLNKPELKVSVDREKAATVGAGIDTIGRTLETLLGGRNVTRFKRGSDQYEVIVQVADVDRSNPDDLTSIYVRGTDNQMVQLSNLVQVRESVAAKELNHFDKLRAATISANLAPGYSLGEALGYLQEIVAEVAPPTTRIDYKGVSREFVESGSSLYITFVLALFFIYLVLAAQFESFIDPLIILFSVPLAMAGALLALQLTGGTLNIYSQIGLITLVGLITKHGILIVEFANQLQEQGQEKLEAVVEAAVLRLRPILMTTGAMVLGAVPLALAEGAGAESRQQIGWVIVGGMSFGTLLTLLVVPAVYLLLARRREVAGEGVPVTV